MNAVPVNLYAKQKLPNPDVPAVQSSSTRVHVFLPEENASIILIPVVPVSRVLKDTVTDAVNGER